MDSFTEVSSEGWLSRIGGAIKGVVVGVVLVAVSIGLLWWNEGRAVNEMKKINFASDNIVSVGADSVDAANDGKLVHVSGKAITKDVLKDDTFGVSANAIKLVRQVEMYQWEEKKETKSRKKLGGGKETITTYNYVKEWSSSPNDSSSFKKKEGHLNPKMEYSEKEFLAKDVKVGAFKLSSSLIGRISGLDSIKVDKLPETMEKNPRIILYNGGIYIGTALPAVQPDAQPGTQPAVLPPVNPAVPQIGDVRITFKECKPKDVSILAGQTNGSFSPFTTPYGNFDRIDMGIQDAKAMISNAHSSNAALTWILRVVGFIVMLIAFTMIFKPLEVVADVIPLLGDLVGMGTGILAFLLAASLSLLTVSIAWIFYRPLIGIPLFLVAVAGIVVIILKRKKKAVA